MSGAYYTYHWLKKKRAKRQKTRYGAHSSAAEQNNAPFEQRPLVDLKYRDLKELSEPISVVVTPPGGVAPGRAGRLSQIVGAVGDRLRRGYNGIGMSGESFAMEDMGRRVGRRPNTE